jgi:tetratricopeptide (TPR) repeat protein
MSRSFVALRSRHALYTALYTTLCPALFSGALALSVLSPTAVALARAPQDAPADVAAQDAQHIETLVARGLHPLAAKEARRFLERYPRHAEADRVRYRLAGALAAQQQFDAARELYAELSQQTAFDWAGEAAQRLGQLELDAGRLEPASVAFARALELGPAYLRPAAAHWLGETEYRRQRWAEAEAAWELVLREAGEDAQTQELRRSARAGRAWCAFQMQRWDEVVARVEQCSAVDSSADLDELWLLAGDAHSRAHRPTEARAAYGRVRSKAHAELGLRGAAYAALDAGDEAGASSGFTDLLRRYPQGAHASDAAIQLGALRLRSGDARAALALLSSAPLAASAEAQYWRARAEQALERPTQALATLERALTLAPAAELAPRIQALRAELLLAAGRPDEARAALAATGSAAALQAAMAAALNGGDPVLAAEFARDLAARFPDSAQRADAELVLAEELFQRKQYAAARDAFDALANGVAAPELQRRAALRGAWSTWLAGDRAAAAQRFAALEPRCAGTPEAAELRTARARCQIELAEELARTGDATAAVQAWRAALDANVAADTAPRARLGLAWALYQSGATVEAERELAVCLADRALDATQRAEALELRVWTLVKLGSAAPAVAAWRAYASDSAPSTEQRRAEAARAVANLCADGGDPTNALALLDECLRGMRTTEFALSLLEDATWFALKAERIDAAESRARAAAKAAPSDERSARACRAVADAWLARKDPRRALEWYEAAAVAPGGERGAALYGAAWCRLETNDARGARDTLARLLALPELGELTARARYLAGETCWKLAELSQAAEHYRAALEAALEPALAPRAWLRVATGELESGRAEPALAALEQFDQLVRSGVAGPIDGRDEAALTRARALLLTERAADGLAQLEQLAAATPSLWSARAALALAAAAQARGDDDAALSQWIKLSGRWGGEAERSRALYDAARVFERRGDGVQALLHYDELLDAHPQCALAADAARHAQALRGSPRAAAGADKRRR